MILLQQNTTNSVYLSLSESITYSATPVYFLFKFTDETSKDDVFFTAADLSTNTVRYNQFNISLTGNAFTNYTAGTISLNPDGNWSYEVYEQLSQTNLYLSGTSGQILTNGFVKISGTNLSDVSYTYTAQTQTWNYYEPQ